jgi:3-deoxy-D-arabino-heptulosonate 7-phosphate (DAHP) synthase
MLPDHDPAGIRRHPVEVHPRPAEAACDRDQQLDPAAFAALMPAVRALAAHLRGDPAGGRP